MRLSSGDRCASGIAIHAPRRAAMLIVRTRISSPRMPSSPSSKHLVTTPLRSSLMKRVRRENTAPELLVRRFLHRRGLRYRLHEKRLPGRPDLVLPARSSVIFVQGCFWHGHACVHGAVKPRQNASYWELKIQDNRARDERQQRALAELGWNVEVIWECELDDESMLAQLATRLLKR
jgi:DNA mismatch endonuclease (patch repair protein)